MKKVIVVGANGFLGRELCKKLASKYFVFITIEQPKLIRNIRV